MGDIPTDLPPFPPDPSAPPLPPVSSVSDLQSPGNTSNRPSIFGWADTPWTVAALLGAWGVMIGIEEFFLADAFMVLAGVSCTARLARDCFQHRRRRWVPFFLWIAIIVTVVGVDVHLTVRKRESSEAKAGEIPGLKSQIQALNGTIQAQSTELSNAQGHTDQHVADIQEENKRLRASIDKKDAALVAIAQQELFSPQIVVSSTGPNEIRISNTGKSAVVVLRLIDNGLVQTCIHTPTSIAKDSWISYTFSDDRKAAIVAQAKYDDVTKDYRSSQEDTLLIETENHKRYDVPFTVVATIKDGAIVNVTTIVHPISEATRQ